MTKTVRLTVKKRIWIFCTGLLCLQVLAQSHIHAAVLADPAFETISGQGGPSTVWSQVQHAGEPSYKFSAQKGELTITRTGSEPWGILVQELDMKTLRGRTISFKAEAMGDFLPMTTSQFEPTGISLRVTGFSANPALRMLGSKVLVDKVQPVDGKIGEKVWQTYEIIAEIPDAEVEGEISFRLTRDGALKVRNPRVEILSDAQDDKTGL